MSLAIVKFRPFPTGQTSASKIKALLLCLEEKKGARVAQTWLAANRLERTDIDDETRLLPLNALHAALQAFVRELPDGLDAVGPYLVVPENLGVWARMLRGTRSPEQAFGRIDSSESEHGRTTRWETIESASGHWKGRVRIAHDPALEEDGLLARLRAIELSVVPMLFGFSPGVVTRDAAGRETQTFDARWSLPDQKRDIAIGAIVGVALGAGVYTVQPTHLGMGIGVVLAAASCAAGYVRANATLRGIEAGAQMMRVSALERSLALRDTENRAAAGDLEGNVVAGQYRIGTRMGSGASGVIYEATRLTDGMPVAIKLLRAATAHDAVASDRLRREAEALGLSWHPNVVEVIDHGHLPDGTSYMVMELLSGEPLATRLKARIRLAADEIFPIGIQVSEAMVAIHAAGVLHRDLKPANIFMTRDESEERVKILDFGIARVEWEEMRITNTGAPLGTPGYMSPEQESGGEVDARSDLYAVGAVLYECFVGEPPPPVASDMWKNAPPLESLQAPAARIDGGADSGVHPASRRLLSAAPSVPVDVPAGWRAVIERALAKKPEDRFQDARSLLTAVRALAAESTASTKASTSTV